MLSDPPILVLLIRIENKLVGARLTRYVSTVHFQLPWRDPSSNRHQKRQSPGQTSDPVHIFSQIRSLVSDEIQSGQTDRQTNKQTNKRTNSKLNTIHYRREITMSCRLFAT